MSRYSYDFDDYVGESDTREVSLLLSARSQALLLAAIRHMEAPFSWRNVADDAEWDDILRSIDNAEFEIMDVTMPDFTPVGTIANYVSITMPSDKWLVCGGQQVSKTTYAELYALIGTIFGAETTSLFRLPNMLGKFVYGHDVSGDIGDTGGELEHTLTAAELPAHVHTIAHTHTIPIADNGGVQARAARGTSTNIGTLTTSASSAPNSGSVGSDTPHNNLPPYLRLVYMIKALP